ncbi:oxalate decarboxylase [Halenospora varia]|nr:oxalate decarboxylase [Halenospora varia]
MKFINLVSSLSLVATLALASPFSEKVYGEANAQLIEKRDANGQPIDPVTGKGGPILGGTNHQIDLANPDNLAAQSTDNGLVTNLKWSFSDSKTKIFNGGWTRTQVVTDLPSSHDIASAQQHLKKGALRELHWHRVAEWGYVYSGEVLVSAVDEDGNYQVDKLGVGDIWYFPKGAAHTVQGLADENEYLLVFDDGDFESVGTTFMVDDWIAHTPKSILAKNFGVNASVFDTVPTTDPYILNATVSPAPITGPESGLTGNSSYVIHRSQYGSVPVPGGGGNLSIIDSRNFPISKTIAATVVSLSPGGLRELHWHPNAEEWLYFHSGTARATVFIGGANARTFDFSAGDTAVFPDNSGHYIENTSKTENLVWIEIYKSERVADIPLTQWLALTPADIVASTLKIPLSVVNQLKKEKQVLIKGN